VKKSFLFFLASVLTSAIYAGEGKHIILLHTNDLHSRLYGFSPEYAYTPLQTNDDETVGGFARIAAIIKNEKLKDPDATIVADGGDFLMGTLFHSLEASTGFQLGLMKKMGYDVVCTGNHEFDFGPGKLAEILAQSERNGEIPPVLLSNAVFSNGSSDDDGLEQLLSAGTLKRKFIIQKAGLTIGIFSLVGKDAADVAPNSKPVSFARNIPFAKRMVKELKKEGCDVIICLSHSGLSKDKNGKWTGEDVKLARSVKGIDVIVSGHTHTRLEEPVIVKGIPIIQSGEYGQNIGKLEFTFTDGHVRVDKYTLIQVDDSTRGDGTVEEMIDKQKELVDKYILEPLGIKYFDPVAYADFQLECNEQGDFKAGGLGSLVADAVYSYVNRHTEKGCDISIVAAGVIRDRIVPGILSAPDVFRIMSLGSGSDDVPGYPLAKVYVTGKELKNILEILHVAYRSSPSNYCFYSGLKAVYDPDRGLLRKISKIELVNKNGSVREVDFSAKNRALYSITANSYMLEFIGIIKKMSLGLINVVPKDESGIPVHDMRNSIIDVNEEMQGIQEGKEWIALMEYLRSMSDSDGDSIPDIDRKYAFPERSFSTVTKR